MNTGLVVPCYNEAHRLPFDQFREYLGASPIADLLFVDDGSTDRTPQLLESMATAFPQPASVLRLARNAGKGEAVRHGLLELLGRGFEQVGFWDADLATPLDAVPAFIKVLDDRPAVEWVFGARVQLLGRDIVRKRWRHYLGRAFATAASTMLHLPIYDTQCGAKLFRATPLLRELLDRPFASRWLFEVEMIARLGALGHVDAASLIVELPLERWHHVAGSKVRPLDFPRAALELLRIRRKYGRPAWSARG